MRQINQLNFAGKTIYCGADVHKASWSICLMMDDRVLKRFSQPPMVEALEKTLKGQYPGARYEVAYEAGFCGFSPQRNMADRGIDCMVVNPSDVPTMDKEKQQKSDPVDCGKLARCLSAGMLTPLHIPSVQQQDDRCIIRNYLQFVKDQTRCKNRITSALYFQGIAPRMEDDTERASYWSKNYIRWLKHLPMATSQARKSLDLLIQSYEYTREQVLQTTRELRKLALEDRYMDQIALIRSVPGIGQIGALLFLTEIGDFNRFKGIDKLCSFIGLIPNTQSSGEHNRASDLTHRGHAKLREILIEASWKAIRLDPAMTLAFSNYTKKMKKNQAIIKIAKKLLSRINYVMKHQT
ncbi:MAG TPA: IS110 family transposase, partial [Chitinophagaceae bacterium]|nr:IS110 family transposase [Chitinophagaceae bacterium]